MTNYSTAVVLYTVHVYNLIDKNIIYFYQQNCYIFRLVNFTQINLTINLLYIVICKHHISNIRSININVLRVNRFLVRVFRN